MRVSKKGLLGMATAGALAALCAVAGCSQGATESTSSDTSTTEATTTGQISIPTGYDSWSEYAAEYPDQVNSFFEGIDRVQADSRVGVDSHAMLYANVNNTATLLDDYGMTCIACKSSVITDRYDEVGYAAYDEEWDTDSTDWFDCALCHEDGDPEGDLQPNSVVAKSLISDFLSTLDSKDAVCGQCHNYTEVPYVMSNIMDGLIDGSISSDDIDPYRYGTDPDSLLKAALEDGAELSVDEASGVAVLNTSPADIEIFQGSVMQSMGVTCVDCHGQTMTNEDGEEYTSHDFSSTPIESDETLEYCLTCHSSQGIETVEDMRQFVKDAEEESNELLTTYYEKQDVAYDLLCAATAGEISVDEATLDELRSDYQLANWYAYYANGNAETYGTKIAHNPDAIISYTEQAIAIVDDIVAALS